MTHYCPQDEVQIVKLAASVLASLFCPTSSHSSSSTIFSKHSEFLPEFLMHHACLPSCCSARNVICRCVLIYSYSFKTFIMGVYVFSPVHHPEISHYGQEMDVSVGRCTVLGESQDGCRHRNCGGHGWTQVQGISEVTRRRKRVKSHLDLGSSQASEHKQDWGRQSPVTKGLAWCARELGFLFLWGKG